MEGKNLLDRGALTIVQLKANAGLRLLLTAFEFKSKLNEKQLLKNQPDVSSSARGLQILQTLARLRPVHSAQRFARRDQIQTPSDYFRDGIRHIRWQILQRSVDHTTEPSRGQPPLSDGFIDRHNPADLQRGSDFLLGRIPRFLIAGFANYFELRLHDLQFAAANIGFHLSVEGDYLTGFEFIAKISSVEPDTLQPCPPLSGRHLKNGHAACAEQAGIADFSDDRRHLSRSEFGDAARVQPVFIAKREIMQQVVNGVDALARQHFGQPWADAFYILHGSGRFQHLKRW